MDCLITGHMESCVAAINGGSAVWQEINSRSAESAAFAGSILVEKSTLSDSLKLQGVVAQGLNSTVFISNSSIFDCSGTCVLALQGGCIDMEKCKVYSSTTMQGVCAQGKGSKINLKNSRGLRLCMMINLAVCNLFTVYDCMQTCVVSLNGTFVFFLLQTYEQTHSCT